MEKSFKLGLTKWQRLIGMLCFNIWHNTNQEFEKSGNFIDMEWPFLCAFYIFHHWDSSRLVTSFSIPELLPEVDPALISLKDTFVGVLPNFKVKIEEYDVKNEKTGKLAIEPAKVFISIFTDDFIDIIEKDFGTIHPKDFFQVGVELLLLFTLDIKEKDPSFFAMTSDIGKGFTEEAEAVLDQINWALEG